MVKSVSSRLSHLDVAHKLDPSDRSTDSGATWSPLWAWNGYPNIYKYYTYSDSLAPWLGPSYVDTTLGDLQIGWMMEGTSQFLPGTNMTIFSALVIDPFDSNHWLYGTGATIYGGHDLLKVMI